MLSSSSLWVTHLISLSAAWVCSIANQPPFQPNAEDQTRRDDQASLNFVAKDYYPRYATALILGFEALQIGAAQWQYYRGGFCERVALTQWSSIDWIGSCMLLTGSLMRIGCYRSLGRFFTYKVSPAEVIRSARLT